jgi:hypothetical protein
MRRPPSPRLARLEDDGTGVHHRAADLAVVGWRAHVGSSEGMSDAGSGVSLARFELGLRRDRMARVARSSRLRQTRRTLQGAEWALVGSDGAASRCTEAVRA